MDSLLEIYKSVNIHLYLYSTFNNVMQLYVSMVMFHSSFTVITGDYSNRDC